MTPTPDAARWPAIKTLFESVADLAPADRATHIGAAALDGASHAELMSLLQHHDLADSGPAFMAEPASQVLHTSAARIGQRLGAWEIVRAVGSGGMGEVFEVRRADGQYDGRAAVKLLKRGMDSAAVLQRFAQERQALARLSHPHIARLLDAGASDDGLPYFVLEYVDGRPIDEAVRGLSLERRLGLFLQLADAVVHAHRNLLVHRDLKPGNVLVDAEGSVKLLDFGIAKALDPLEGHQRDATGHTTVAGQRPFTPHYASPEQVRGEPVSTATDIYSLGVLLYQLLTGTRPTGRRATTSAEAARSVLEEQPTRPSRLSASEALDPQWLSTRKRLEGDLDNILLKALEKSPHHRYGSAEAMAADVQAYIEGRPVTARPANPGYVLGKFLRRNQWPVLAGGLGGLGLTTGLSAALLQERAAVALGAGALAVGLALALFKGRQASLARAQAEQHVADLRKLCRDVVLEYGDVITYLPDGMARKVAMLTSTLAHLDRLAPTAVGDHSFQVEIGMVCARLADLQVAGNWNAQERPETAAQHARRAVAMLSTAGAAHHADARHWWVRALRALAKCAQQQRQFDVALAHLAEADTVATTGLQRLESHPLRSERAAVLMQRASVHCGYNAPNQNRPDAALAILAQAQALYLEMTRGPGVAAMEDVFQVGTVAGSRALIFARQERWAEAVAASSEALTQRGLAHSMEPHNRVVQGAVAADHNLLCALHLTAGDKAQALLHGRAAWALLQTLISEDPANQVWPVQRRNLALNLGRALTATGDAQGALPVLQLSADGLAAAVQAGNASPLQRRRHAQTVLAQADALHATGQVALASARATQAANALQALVEAPDAERDSFMVLGECAVCLSRWTDGPDAEHWKTQARNAYDHAERMQPLTAEHARRAEWARGGNLFRPR